MCEQPHPRMHTLVTTVIFQSGSCFSLCKLPSGQVKKSFSSPQGNRSQYSHNILFPLSKEKNIFQDMHSCPIEQPVIQSQTSNISSASQTQQNGQNEPPDRVQEGCIDKARRSSTTLWRSKQKVMQASMKEISYLQSQWVHAGVTKSLKDQSQIQRGRAGFNHMPQETHGMRLKSQLQSIEANMTGRYSRQKKLSRGKRDHYIPKGKKFHTGH